MIGGIIYAILHVALMFACVIVAKLAEDDDAIMDADFWIIIAVFFPWGVIAILGALYLAAHVIHVRDERRYHDRYDSLR